LLFPFRGPIGVPELFLVLGGLLFIAFWVVLIGAIVRGRERFFRASIGIVAV
jgi:hypothetical protein